MERQRLEVLKLEDRYTLVRILASNGYSVRIVDAKVDGKKKVFVEYWQE